MAIIDRGEILLQAESLRAVDDLRRRIGRRVIAKEELPGLEREHAVISTKLLAGRTVAHIYSDTALAPASTPPSRTSRMSLQHDGRARRPAPRGRNRDNLGASRCNTSPGDTGW